MAETVRIEIPIEAVDRTQAGVQSALKSFNELEKSVDRSLRRLSRIENGAHRLEVAVEDNATDRMADIEQQAERIDAMEPNIDIDAANAASETIQSVADQAEALDGTESDVDLGADDGATQVIRGAGDAVENFDGMSGSAELTADDGATQVIHGAGDAVESYDGMSGSADIGAEDNSTPIVTAAKDEVESFSGVSGSADIGANDNASPVIDSVRDKAAAWDGSVWTATVSIVDAATAPLQAAIDAVKNPLTQAGAALGVSIGLGNTIDTYSTFEATMSQVKALADATDAEMEALTNKAKEMGAVTKYSGTESAEAFTFMAQAGWTSQQMIDGIGGVMSLAASDGIALADATDIVANALTSFGLTAKDTARFADVLAVASSATNTDVAGLGEALKYVAPVAGAMSYNIEDVSLALGLMSNNGIKGSMAGTALKTSLANLAAPTDKMQEAMDKYGISLIDSEGNMKSLRGVMDNLRSSLGGLDEAEQTAAASTIFGKEAMSGMLSIINASQEGYESLAEQIENSTGAADRMAETMQDNLAGSLEQLGGAVETVQLSWGERLKPYVAGIADALADAMPGIEQVGLSIFDTLDSKAAQLKNTISEMTDSEEWQNADLFGKVNIAWDKIVAEPFTKWAGSKGKTMLSKGLSTLFGEAAKILPGGEEAGLTSWLSAGLIAKGATSLVGTAQNVVSALAPIGGAIKSIGTAASEASSVGGFLGNLGSMIPMAGKLGLAAAAITAAVVGISTAIDNYNQKRIETSLAEHFGDITLTAEEMESIAGQILNVEWLANVNLSLGHLENADELAAEAEAALQANDALEWKSTVGIELTADDQQNYTENIQTFIDSSIKELEERTYFAKISVDTVLAEGAGSSLSDAIDQWYQEDSIELSGLSESLTALVQEALEDGVLDVEEQAAIDILQTKINNILSGWKDAEAQAKWDLIEQKYGRLTGQQLEAGSFTSLLEEMQNQRQADMAALDENAEGMYAMFNGWANSGKITEQQHDALKELWGYNYKNLEGESMIRSLGFESNTLSDAYANVIDKNYSKMQEKTENFMSDLQETWDYTRITGNNLGMAFELADGVDKYKGTEKGLSSEEKADFAALGEMYEAMKPDVTAMGELIDSYRQEGLKVPTALMDSFNEAIKIGAAAGDTDAAWQMYANDLIANGSEEIVDALTNESNPMYELLRGALPEEMTKAIDRATQETAESADLSELFNKILGEGEIDEIDLSRLQELCDKYGLDISEYLEQHGFEVDGSGAKMKLTDFDPSEVAEYSGLSATGKAYTLDGGEVAMEYTVNTADTLSGIAEKTGVTLEELKEANQHILEQNGSWDLIYEGDLIYVPQVDTTEAQAVVNEEISQAISELTSSGAEFTVSADGVTVDLTDVQVDSDSAAAQIEAALGMEAGTLEANGITVETGAAITVPSELITVDTSALQDAMQETAGAADTEPIEKETSATVTVTDTTTNASGSRDEAQTELQTAFDESMQADGSAEVTLTQSNNVDAIYAEVDGVVKSKFASGFTADASVAVTLNWSLVNPTASISVGGAGTGSGTVSASIHAAGGEVGRNGPELSWVGEEGLEYIIPTVPSRRSRGISLWEQAGQELGVLDSNGQIAGHAAGGIVGPSGEVQADDAIIPLVPENGENGTVWSVTGEEKSGYDDGEGEAPAPLNAAPPQNQQNANGGNVIEVNVDMSPVIQIDGEGMDEQKIFEVMMSRCRELADDLGDEIAERMGKIFENMPLVQEA